jgi:hypothetical protein
MLCGLRRNIVFEILLALFMEQGFVCMDLPSAQQVATAFTIGQDEFVATVETNENCGAVTGELIPLKAVSNLYSRTSGWGVRVVEAQYLGKTVYYFRLEYGI